MRFMRTLHELFVEYSNGMASFIDFVNQFEGVEWCTFEYMAEEFRAGRI